MTTTRKIIVALSSAQLSAMTPHNIAEHYGIGYTGDMNPIPHGGYFYSLQDWEPYGYSSTVEFYVLEDDHPHPSLHVQEGTINRADQEEVFHYAEQSFGQDVRDMMLTPFEIECTRDYHGIESGDTGHRWADVDNVDECEVWSKVEPMLRFLSPHEIITQKHYHERLCRQCNLITSTPSPIVCDRADELGIPVDENYRASANAAIVVIPSTEEDDEGIDLSEPISNDILNYVMPTN